MALSVARAALALAASLAVISTADAGSVIGIDFGSENLKIALVKPGVPLDIVLTPEGQRKVPTMIGFADGEQLLGHKAELKITKKPLQVFKYPKLMLGKGPLCPIQQWYKDHYYPYVMEEAADGRGGSQVSVPGGGGFDALNYTAEALVGQILAHARELAEATAEETVKESVITVPPFWGQDQRQAILDAAELAGLKVLSLMNENTAVAMKYAIDRKFENTKEHNVIFYDMGASSLKTSFVTFSAYDVLDGKKNKTVESFEVKAVAWDEFLGGHDFDVKLAGVFGKQFDEKNQAKIGASVFDSPRVMARLRKEAQRIKVVLSANTPERETPVNIEALSNDIDFRGMTSRAEFEKLSADLIDRAMIPVESLLEQTGKTPEDVHAVVVIGGSSRIPVIKDKLMKTMKRETLNQNLNGDEAAALGAGFYAAGLSPSFRVRKVSVEDIFPFGMVATVSRGANSTSVKPPPTAEVFPKDTKLPLKKVLTFNRNSDFYMDIKVSNPERLPGCDSLFIGSYNISGVEPATKFNETEKPKISITFELDRSGMLLVSKSEAKAESYKEEQVVKVKAVENATDDNSTNTTEGEDKKSKKQAKKDAEKDAKKKKEGEAEKPAEEAEEAKEEAKEEKDEEKKEESGEEEEKKEETEEVEEVEYETKMVKKVHRVALDALFTPVDIVPMTEEQIKADKKIMQGIKKRMDEIAELNKAKNDVEAHIFETRDKLEYDDAIMKVSTDEEKDAIRAALSEAEEWMWDEHEKHEYVAKVKAMQKQMKPLKTRKVELEARPEAVKFAREQIESIKNYVKNETAMAEVGVNETALINKITEEFEAWMTRQEEAQAEKKVTDDPAFLSAHVQEKAVEHRDAVTQALRPKPKPKAPPKKKETKAEKKLRKKVEAAAEARSKVTLVEGKKKVFEAELTACGTDKLDEDEKVVERTEAEVAACEILPEKISNATRSIGKKEKVAAALEAIVVAYEAKELERATLASAKSNVTKAEQLLTDLDAKKTVCEAPPVEEEEAPAEAEAEEEVKEEAKDEEAAPAEGEEAAEADKPVEKTAEELAEEKALKVANEAAAAEAKAQKAIDDAAACEALPADVEAAQKALEEATAVADELQAAWDVAEAAAKAEADAKAEAKAQKAKAKADAAAAEEAAKEASGDETEKGEGEEEAAAGSKDEAAAEESEEATEGEEEESKEEL